MDGTKTDTSVHQMYKAIVDLRDEEECRRFFEELCTDTELRSLKNRFDVAVALLQDKAYMEILKQSATSTATISRVRRNILNNDRCVMRDVIFRNGFAADTGKQEDKK